MRAKKFLKMILRLFYLLDGAGAKDIIIVLVLVLLVGTT